MKMNKENFSISGWFPPSIVNTMSGRYACCGSNWIEIEDDVTIDDVMKGWKCLAPVWTFNKIKIPKRKTKKELISNLK